MLQAHLVDIRNLQNEVIRRCGRHGLGVRFDEDAFTAYTNNKEVVFPALKPPITVEQLKLLACQSVHEPGHQIRGESLELLMKARLPAGHPLGALWNVVEDECMEREVQHQWRGDRVALVEGHRVLSEMTAKSWNEGRARGEKAGENSVKAMAAYLTAIESRKDWDYMAEANADMIRRATDPDAVALADELISEGWAARIQKGGTPLESKQIAYDLFERLYPGHKAEDQEQPESGEGDSTEGDGEDSKGGKPEDGEGEGKAKRMQPKDYTDEEGEDGETQGHMVVKWEDIIKSEHGQEGQLGASSEIDWTGKQRGSNVEFIPEKQITHIKYRELQPTRTHYRGDGLGDRAFANQVRRLIQSTQRVKVNKEQKSGKLDSRNMVRVLLPQRDGGEWNRKVFNKLEDTKHLNTAMTILTDWSGSMSGTKMEVACQSTMRLLDTFDRALHVPTEVLAFSGAWSTLHIGEIKTFAEKNVTSDDVGARFTHFEQYTNGNPDGDAIMVALKRLMARREKRKILIVLSDGSPTGGVGDPSDTLHAAIAEARRMGVEVYGIGILSRAVTHFYGSDCKVVTMTSELNHALIATLDKMIRRAA